MSARDRRKSRDDFDDTWNEGKFPDPTFPPTESPGTATVESPTEAKDLTLRCVDCGEDFIFSVDEQQFFLEKIGKDYTNPKRCRKCRAAKRERQATRTA